MYTRYLERYYFLMTLTDCKSNYLQGDNSEFKINRHFFLLENIFNCQVNSNYMHFKIENNLFKNNNFDFL